MCKLSFIFVFSQSPCGGCFVCGIIIFVGRLIEEEH